MFNDDIVYGILSYIHHDYDYSSLAISKTVCGLLKQRYIETNAYELSHLIECYFSRLFYLHIIYEPPCKQDVDTIFSRIDVNGIFNPPEYYGLHTYMRLFREYDEYVLGAYMANVPYDNYVDTLQNKKHMRNMYKWCKYRCSRLVYTLLL